MSRKRSRREIESIVESVVDEKLEEYLGAPPNETSSEQLAGQRDDPDQWAYEVMAGQDVQKCNEEQLAPAEYVKEEYGVSPAECDTREEFRSRVEQAG